MCRASGRLPSPAGGAGLCGLAAPHTLRDTPATIPPPSQVSRLRTAASSLQAELDAHKRAAAEQLESLTRACESDLARVKGELSAALDDMVKHRLWVSQTVEATARVVHGARDAVRAGGMPGGV
eukprot:363804-Chlamydomonas_euryale.AAC.3